MSKKIASIRWLKSKGYIEQTSLPDSIYPKKEELDLILKSHVRINGSYQPDQLVCEQDFEANLRHIYKFYMTGANEGAIIFAKNFTPNNGSRRHGNLFFIRQSQIESFELNNTDPSSVIGTGPGFVETPIYPNDQNIEIYQVLGNRNNGYRFKYLEDLDTSSTGYTHELNFESMEPYNHVIKVINETQYNSVICILNDERTPSFDQIQNHYLISIPENTTEVATLCTYNDFQILPTQSFSNSSESFNPVRMVTGMNLIIYGVDVSSIQRIGEVLLTGNHTITLGTSTGTLI